MTLYPKLILDALATVRYPAIKRTSLRRKWLPIICVLTG
mgnify:FL=1